MKYKINKPSRKFVVGKSKIMLSDAASIYLKPDEQVTFKDERGAEYDVCRKTWGYYATPSINGRLKNFGFKTAIVENKQTEMLYIMLVNEEMMDPFEEYLSNEDLFVVKWMS